MKLPVLIVGLCVAATSVTSGVARAESSQTTVTKVVTINGEVVRYEPGQMIVVRGSDDKEVTYTLSANVAVPKDVQVGRQVTLYTEPGPDGGTQVVRRVVTTSVTPEGNVKRTTEDTRNLPSGATSKTTTTEVSGTVAAYQAGKMLTITRDDGTKVTYMINAKSTIPSDLAVGKVISIVPMVSTDANGNVVQTVTYVTIPPDGQ